MSVLAIKHSLLRTTKKKGVPASFKTKSMASIMVLGITSSKKDTLIHFFK
uniref:Uncharacterized protein n=1 Tax=Lepeophtheirus salmonis TaxID=72036 RepID=A0A0K2T4F8_LEPSM